MLLMIKIPLNNFDICIKFTIEFVMRLTCLTRIISYILGSQEEGFSSSEFEEVPDCRSEGQG